MAMVLKSFTGITNFVFRFLKWFVLTVAIKKRLQLHFICQRLDNTLNCHLNLSAICEKNWWQCQYLAFFMHLII